MPGGLLETFWEVIKNVAGNFASPDKAGESNDYLDAMDARQGRDFRDEYDSPEDNDILPDQSYDYTQDWDPPPGQVGRQQDTGAAADEPDSGASGYRDTTGDGIADQSFDDRVGQDTGAAADEPDSGASGYRDTTGDEIADQSFDDRAGGEEDEYLSTDGM